MVILLSCTKKLDKQAVKAWKSKSVLHTLNLQHFSERLLLHSWKMKKQFAYYFACENGILKKQIYQSTHICTRKDCKSTVHRSYAHVHIKGKLTHVCKQDHNGVNISFIECTQFKCIWTKYSHRKMG